MKRSSQSDATAAAFYMPLKLALVQSGKTQRAIAKAARLDESVLCRIVRGQNEPTRNERLAIARALRLDVADVFPDYEMAS